MISMFNNFAMQAMQEHQRMVEEDQRRMMMRNRSTSPCTKAEDNWFEAECKRMDDNFRSDCKRMEASIDAEYEAECKRMQDSFRSDCRDIDAIFESNTGINMTDMMSTADDIFSGMLNMLF